MKLKKLISGFFLAATLAIGVGAALESGLDKKAEGVDAATSSVTLAGSFNSWNTTADPLILSGDYWTIEKTLSKDDEFKIVVNGNDWVGDGDGVSWCSGLGSNGKGQNFKVLENGNYRIKAVKTIGDYGDKSYGISFERYSVITKYAVVDGTKESTPLATEKITYNTSYAVPSKIYRANYECAGWFTNQACTSSYSAQTITTNKDLFIKYTHHDNWTGTINVDLLTSSWDSAASNYAVLLMDKSTYSAEVNGWSTYVTGVAIGVRLVSISYSIPFEPKLMTIVRYNSSKSQASWNTNKWTDVWSQTSDISYNTMIRIGDNNSAIAGYPKVMGGSPWAEKGHLDSVKLNGSNHAEYYGSVTLAKNEKFNILKAPYNPDGDYAASFTTHPDLADNFADGGSGSVEALVAGTYSVYFDSSANSLYITSVAAASADEWAQYFLANVGCDATGVNPPSGWSACAAQYALLIDGAKDIIYRAEANPSGSYVEKAVARYDQALRSHPSLSHFIVDSKNVVRSVSIARVTLFSSSSSNTAITVIIVSIISVAAVGGFFFIRRKKHN